MMQRGAHESVQEQGLEPPPAGAWGVAATLGMSVSYIDRQTMAAIAPAVRSALGIGHAQYGWLVSAFSMAYLVGAPVAGIVVDRLGARRGFAAAVVLWSLVAGAHAFAVSFATLFALRVMLGAAEAPSFPAAAQAIRRALPGAKGSAAYGLLFTGSYIGAMIAAPLAIGLEARFGFRFAFVGTAAIGTLWIPFWLYATRGGRLSQESPALEAEGPKAIYRGPGPFTAPQVKTPWTHVARSAPVLRALVMVVGSAPALMFVLNWTSQYLVEAWHLPRTSIAGYLVIPPLLFDLGAVGFGWLASRRELRTHRDLVLVAMVMAASLALSPLAPSPFVAMLVFGVAACGGGGLYVMATADMLGRVPLDRTSAAAGMTAAAQSLAHIVVSPLVGAAIDRTHSFTGVLVALGLGVIPTSLAFVLWPSLRAR